MVFGSVLWTMVCAIFGAAFGYILGGIVELFVGGTGLPAMLAAIGFIAGAVLGILISLAMMFAWRGVRSWKIHDWGHGFGRSFRRYHRNHDGWAWRNYWWDGCAGDDRLYSADDALQEMDGYLSYLEDLPGDKLASCGDKMDRLSERLDRLRASLRQ